MNCGLLFSLEKNDGKGRLCGYKSECLSSHDNIVTPLITKFRQLKLGIENFQIYMVGPGFH